MSKPVTVIALALFLPALFLVLLFFVHDYADQTNQNLSQSMVTRLQEIHQRHTNSLERTAAAQLAELKSAAAVLDDKTPGEAASMVTTLAPMLRAQGLRCYSLTDLDGKGTDCNGNPVDHSHTPAFLRARAGAAGFSMRETSPQDRCLIMAAPVWRSGQVAAVLVGGVKPNRVEQSLESMAFGRSIYTVVVDDNAQALFWTPPPEKRMEDLLPLFGQEGLPPSLRGFLQRRFKAGLQNAAVHFADHDSGQRLYLYTSPLPDFGWQVVSLLPQQVEKELVARQNAITTTLIWRIILVVTLLAVALMYMVRRAAHRLRLQQEDYRSIISSISDGVIKFAGLHGPFLFLSPNFLKMLGYSREEFLHNFGHDFASTIYEHDRESALNTMEQQLESGLHIDAEYRVRAKSGALIWMCHKGSPVSVDHGAPYIQSIIFDVSHNKEAAQAKRISDERYHFILEQHDIIIFEQNLESGHFSCSAQWLQTFGRVFNILEPDPQHTGIPVHEQDRERLAAFQTAVRQRPHHVKIALDLRLYDAERQARWYRIEASNLTNAQDKPIYVFGIITDIDQQKALEFQLRSQANRDSATGMRNKKATEQAAARMLDMLNQHEDAPGDDGGNAMFMIDFDNFKSVNDRLGHAAGDKAIIEMARIISRNFRNTDIVGRVGGDEFLVFCTARMSREQIRQRAQRLVSQLRTQCRASEASLSLTASLGVACYPQDGRDFATLFNHADMATYAAKRQGRNRCVFYGELTDPTDVGQVTMEPAHEEKRILGTLTIPEETD
ncbi:sensor domain-containing diguanylate cyclase [Desulfovibrio legallii]|uniref:PAS domain S-box-containing protein/diguanylate cyclase (GGDEF) domain-containing protein n=1 Tax=Desulfovibrio legallii TaxID=571438 RepID=A0A1G7QKC8_9BACT|nr:diguanylate cyclase [Desulfovibrio legallii]SDF98973.1 PAS domain S-box-containing protein/diguanylate cyclase (GGDEF) domain-containing protein [Desulfovibrio legallii]